jgi:serine/threonine protein kinase
MAVPPDKTLAHSQPHDEVIAPTCFADTGPPQAIPLAEPAPGQPRTVGNYELLSEIGRGGMGVVYKARQKGLNRIVALKMVLTGEHAGERERARFKAEGEAVARLQHPNIVQIYEIGEWRSSDGGAPVPFFSLEFVDGGSLAQKIAGAPQPSRQAAALVETLARAIDHAHQQGIVHRDLKPANVLLTARGMPKITDFGLAKQLEKESGETRTGAILGTPSYIAPEQAAGKNRDIGPAVDVYALGAILYELLTGRPPFRGETPLDTMLQVMTDEPAAPAQLCPKVPRDLETICLKCLQKDPRKRYPSAAALADDLRRFLRGEAVQARPVGTPERVWRWCRRRPLVASLLASLMLMALIGVASITVLWRQAENQRRRAETLAAEAQEQRALAEQQRQRAEQNYLQARKAVDDFFTRVSEEKLLQVRNLQPLRKQLLEDALKYYQDFLKQHGNDPSLRGEMAATYLRVARIQREIGSRKEAINAVQKAVELRPQLLQADPNNAAQKRQLAEALALLGRLQGETGQSAAGLRSLEQARELLEPLLRAQPDDRELAQELTICFDGMGMLHRLAGRLPDALRCYEQAAETFAKLDRAKPTGGLHRNLAGCYMNMAVLNKEMGRTAEALRLYHQARGILEAIRLQAPAAQEFQRDLAGVYNNLGGLHAQNGETAEALRWFLQAHTLFDRLARDNPSVIQYQHDLAASLANLGRLQLSQPEEALPFLRRAAEILERLFGANPDITQVQLDLSRLYNYLGDAYLNAKQPADARLAYERGAAVASLLVKAHPDNAEYRKLQAALVAKAKAQPR